MSEKLIVATDAASMPFVFKQGDRWAGFDIDLCQAIANELKVSYVLKPMTFSNIIPSLQARNVDMAIACITITSQRKQVIDFSDSYYGSGLSMMVNAANQNGEGGTNLEDKIVAVKQGTTAETYAKTNLNLKELRLYPTFDEAYRDLTSGRAHAVIHDTPCLLAVTRLTNTAQFNVVTVDPVQPVGIAFPKGSGALCSKVNAALNTLRGNGMYSTIHEKWFGVEPDTTGEGA